VPIRSLSEAAREEAAIRRVLQDLSIGASQAARNLQWIGFETTESSVRRWRLGALNELEVEKAVPTPPDAETAADSVTFSTDDRAKLHDKLDALLDETNADPGQARGLRVAAWDTMSKDANKEPVVTRLYGVRVETARWAPSWPVVQQATPP